MLSEIPAMKSCFLMLAQCGLPERGYKAAKRRYDELGQWFDRPECGLGLHDPRRNAERHINCSSEVACER